MAFKVKNWSYEHHQNEIVVKDHVGILGGREEVYLNGTLIAFHKSAIYKFEKYDNVLINENVQGKNGDIFHLKVICGMHLNWSSRTHIFVNGVLVGGDINKPIYGPPCPWFCLMIGLSIISLLHIFTAVLPDVYKYIHKKNEIKTKIISDSPDLWQKEVEWFFHDKNLALKDEKKELWTKKCFKDSDHHCRLLSYLYSVDNDFNNRITFAVKSCKSNEALSCYLAYRSPFFNVKHPDYLTVVNHLKGLCLKSTLLTDREKIVCSEFSVLQYRESGDLQTFKSISEKLCREGSEESCKYSGYVEET